MELDVFYARSAETFLNAVAPILCTTAVHFPYYTRHDAHHGFRVLRRVEQVIKPGCLSSSAPEALSAPEIYLIILAAYAHDLGMTVFPGEADRLLVKLNLSKVSGWKTNAKLQTHLRSEHSKRGGSYVQENARKLVVPLNLLDALDRIMRAHNLSISALEAEISPDYAAQEQVIDVRQLAIIVCVADALEFSDTRVLEGVLESIAEDPSSSARISYLENMKHVCVGDSLAIDGDGRVVVSGTFLEEEVLALAHLTLDQMESWLTGYRDLDGRLKTPRLRVRSDPFIRNLAFPGGRFERLGVRLNKRNVIDLIASNAIWRDNGGFPIRELLQNAVEACRYRRFHSSLADAYEPCVTVHFDRLQREITVTDNGCGMTERVVLNNLLTVGSSRAAEPGYRTGDYAPIARFGVGFWSVFTIACAALVETASFEPYRGDFQAAREAQGIAFGVSLDELKEYTVFRNIVRPCGTTVRLQLRDHAVIDDILTNAKAQILCSEIPVSFVSDGEVMNLPRVVPDVPDAEVIGARTRVIHQYGIQLFPWRGSAATTDLSMLIAYRIDREKPTFIVEPGQSVMTVLPGIRFPRTSICGFSAPLASRHICLDLGRVGAYFANRTNPKGIAFSLDRSQLVENPTSQAAGEEVTDLIHEGYRAFLNATDGMDLATVAALRQQAAMHGGNVYDYFTGDELYHAARRFPDLAPIKLYPLSGGEPLYCRADEVHNLTGTVFICQRRNYGGPLGRYTSLLNEGEAGVRYVQQALLTTSESRTDCYTIEADHTASWLFDADPDSTVVFSHVQGLGSIPLQVVQLQRIDVSKPAVVMAQVRGRWTGSIYLRHFETPDDKPYLLLGRHRVLVRRSSLLADHFQQLAFSGRLAKLADLVADLTEDEAGYTPASVAALLGGK